MVSKQTREGERASVECVFHSERRLAEVERWRLEKRRRAERIAVGCPEL